MIATGGYAEYAAVPKAAAFPIPDGVSDAQALALLIQGLTAWHLYRTSAHLAEGESVVVHAAAGGVGSLAVQLGKAFGARVIATASTEEKRALALELGADAAVDVTREDLTDALIEANDGRRVDVVLEMAGGRVFDASLRALAPFGRLVTYGMASREPNRVDARQPDAPLVRRHRLLARPLLRAAARRCSPSRSQRPVRARGRAASCAWSRAPSTRCPRRAARTRTSRPAAPPGSCCSTRRPKVISPT